MVIAVPYENEKIYTPFDKAKQFKLYEVIGRRVTDTMIVDSEEDGPYAKTRFLKQFCVDVMLCESIEEEPLLILDDNGIMVYKVIKGDVDDVVYEFLIKNLIHAHNKNYSAEHDHGHSHGNCGEEGCSHCHDENRSCDECRNEK